MPIAIVLESGELDKKQLTSNWQAEFDKNGMTRASRVPESRGRSERPLALPHKGGSKTATNSVLAFQCSQTVRLLIYIRRTTKRFTVVYHLFTWSTSIFILIDGDTWNRAVTIILMAGRFVWKWGSMLANGGVSATVDGHGPSHVSPTVRPPGGTATTDLLVLEGGGDGESKTKLTAVYLCVLPAEARIHELIDDDEFRGFASD